ncbi:MAG: hypothetical protein ACI4N3_02255 [Alphaproteobacteria bacterium]
MAWYDEPITLGDSYDPDFSDEPYDPDLYDKEPKSNEERISDLEKIVERLQQELRERW